MTKNKSDLLSGSPTEVLNRLVNDDHSDSSAAALIAALTAVEQDLIDGGWDQPSALYTCSRNLPPKDIADRLLASIGGSAMMLELRELPGFPDEAPPHIVLNSLAEMLGRPEEYELASALLLADGRDVYAWVFTCEGWGLDGTKEDVEHRPTKFIKDDPRRYEVRIVTAVDRAGYRYQLTRRRDTDTVHLYLDKNPSDEDDDAGLHGRILDALTEIMKATPAESET